MSANEDERGDARTWLVMKLIGSDITQGVYRLRGPLGYAGTSGPIKKFDFDASLEDSR